MEQRNSVIVIPALNPEKGFIEYVKTLLNNGFKKIIVIDDGSSPERKQVFLELASMSGCEIITHAVNMGKGRALKDAFNYYMCKYYQEYEGVITVDSDGQHTAEDVVKIDIELKRHPESLILGVRDFNDAAVPAKSRFGNKMTVQALKLFHGGSISDTQTGLRGIPNSVLPKFLTLNGERFEYETSMLVNALRCSIPILEVPIQTVYIDANKSTHFRPISDSAKIYWIIIASFLKYTLISISSFLLDYGIFCLAIMAFKGFSLSKRVWGATIISRLISSFYNYMANKRFVFHVIERSNVSLCKYYILCVIQLCCSSLLVWGVCVFFPVSERIVKLPVDAALFLFSFQMQQRWVFRRNR